MSSGWLWGEQAELHWSLPMVWPDTSALPYDGCLQSWTGSLEPLCPLWLQDTRALQGRGQTLPPAASMSWGPPGKIRELGTSRKKALVGCCWEVWWLVGRAGRWPRAWGCWSWQCSKCRVSWILAALSPGPSLPVVLAPGRQGEGDMLTSEYNMFSKHVF